MCKMGYLRFDASVPQEKRRACVAALAENSWNMGNQDGIGMVTWDLNRQIVAKSMKLKTFELPSEIYENVFVHARAATCEKNLDNTHPMVADGVFLVHNGIVRIEEKYKLIIKDALKTTNDSEYILAAYLKEGRDMKKSLDRVSGWANVMAWDSLRGKLILYPELHAYEIGRQNGVLCIVQDWGKQTDNIISGGLGHPYEYAQLEHGKIYELDGVEMEIDFDSALAKAKDSAVKQTIGSSSYSPSVPYGAKWDRTAGRYIWERDEHGMMVGRFQTQQEFAGWGD